ncbi:MAG: PEGA domain-containing protein [Planctomycetota bacterium]
MNTQPLRIRIGWAVLATALGLLLGSPASAQAEAAEQTAAAEAEPKTRLAAVFVKNRAGGAFDDKVEAFEDLLTAEVTDLGFALVSREDTIKSIRTALGLPQDSSLPGAELDEALESSTSALRLAQNMGVDYLLVASLATYGSQTQHLNRPDLGIDRRVTTDTLRASYKILDAGLGESLSAGAVTAVNKRQASDSLHDEANTDIVNGLIADAAAQIGERLRAKGGADGVPDSKLADRVVEFLVSCTMQDLSIPEVIKDEQDNYIVTGNRYKLETLAVTVELDGVVIGTAPGKFDALPGLHKIRLTREGFEPWERTINVRDGQHLAVALQLSDEGRANWMQMAEFLNNLKVQERVSEAQAEFIRGAAQTMRQSGVRIDTTDAPSFNQNNIDQQNVAGGVWPSVATPVLPEANQE